MEAGHVLLAAMWGGIFGFVLGVAVEGHIRDRQEARIMARIRDAINDEVPLEVRKRLANNLEAQR